MEMEIWEAGDLTLCPLHNALMPYQSASPHYPSAGSMNAVADSVTWSDPLLATERVIFDRITRGVNPGMNGAQERWTAYALPGLVHRFYAEGGNPYDAMAALLQRVGFKTSNAAGYSGKFGVSLAARTALVINGDANLLTAEPSVAGDEKAPDIADVGDANLTHLINRAQQSLGLTPGVTEMWISEMPTQSVDTAPVVLVAQAPVAGAGDFSKTKNVVGVCSTINNAMPIGAGGAASSYMYKYHHINDFLDKETTSSILIPPKHGVIETNQYSGSWKYRSTEAEAGKYIEIEDSFVIRVVNSKGVIVDEHYFLYVQAPDESLVESCKRSFWKISSSPFDSGSQDYAAWQRASQLSTLLTNASQSLASFQDLAGSAVGQTTGEGATAQITLDTNAAGHGWHIDPTPLDNTDDYLPTSNPNIWQAKAGTDAAGKMDMLSVLLHEYGHALGLEHSAQVGDFMSATLQPGERRLPSADELALMSQLVAELKTTSDSQSPHPSPLPGGEGGIPAIPGNPLSLLGLLPLGFVRRNSAGNGAATGTVHTDYLTAIQPTLTNGSFANGLAQWESTGAVSTAGADAAHYTVTLSESSTTSAGQTHVGQAFVLGATDRFLSFTVSGLNLQIRAQEQH